jgi:hypothetical protein
MNPYCFLWFTFVMTAANKQSSFSCLLLWSLTLKSSLGLIFVIIKFTDKQFLCDSVITKQPSNYNLGPHRA